MEEVKNELVDFDPAMIKVGGGEKKYDEYAQLPAEEPIKAHVVKIKMRKEPNKFKNGELEWNLYTWFEVDEDLVDTTVKDADGNPKHTTGRGQQYRYKCAASIADKPKKSNLYKMLEAMYGKPQTGIDPNEILGRPARIELCAPSGEKSLQFVNTIKAPKPDQERVDVTTSSDVVPTTIEQEIDLDSIPFA